LIFGAGAIGRGFLALNLRGEINFADKDQNLIAKLKAGRSYLTATAETNGYTFSEVKYQNAYHPDEISSTSQYDAVFLAVGCKNCLELSDKIADAKSIFVLENDRSLVDVIKKKTGNDNVYFTVPDVITSNTAPEQLKIVDDLCLVTVKGRLITEKCDHRGMFGSNVEIVSKKIMDSHWSAKFYIHNAPHAIAAYLGAIQGSDYIHEAMANNDIDNIVRHSMRSITDALVNKGTLPNRFANDYMEKELGRFRNPYLYDPISRVAREPDRKLDKNNRLIGSFWLVHNSGQTINPISQGIRAAMHYLDPNADHKMLTKVSGMPETYATQIMRLDPFSITKNQQQDVAMVHG